MAVSLTARLYILLIIQITMDPTVQTPILSPPCNVWTTDTRPDCMGSLDTGKIVTNFAIEQMNNLFWSAQYEGADVRYLGWNLLLLDCKTSANLATLIHKINQDSPLRFADAYGNLVQYEIVENTYTELYVKLVLIAANVTDNWDTMTLHVDQATVAPAEPQDYSMKVYSHDDLPARILQDMRCCVSSENEAREKPFVGKEWFSFLEPRVHYLVLNSVELFLRWVCSSKKVSACIPYYVLQLNPHHLMYLNVRSNALDNVRAQNTNHSLQHKSL